MADTLDSIRTAYACTGPALELGALVVGGAVHPDAPVRIPLSMLNRHGLIAGATGTGKTKALQLIAEQLGDAKATVSTLPTSTLYDLGEPLPSMGIGEAVVTVLSDNGAPTPVAWTRLRPPPSLRPSSTQTAMVAASELLADYGTPVDRDSAYEKLLAKVAPAPQQDQQDQQQDQRHEGGGSGAVAAVLASSVFKSFARAAASAAGRDISRSLFGTASRGRRTTSRRRSSSGNW